MDLRLVITLLCQVVLIQGVFSRSIDQLFAKVEDDFKKDQEGGLQARISLPDWYEYSLVNRSEKLVKLQYDMIITEETWRDVINTTEELPHDRRSKRNAVLEKEKLWTRRISYTISEEFSVQDKLLLLQAMNHWEEYTCLKFVEAKPTDLDVIDFRHSDMGICESHVGRMEGRQPINLSKGCMYKEILVHEIGHALGFYHEHMRADRDQFVKINYKHINASTKFQFDPLVANDYNDYNKPYDYYSVMHYGKMFFSINATAELVTIEPRNATFLDIIGTSPSLSYYDMKIANDLYKCSDGCPVDECEDGFVGGSNCECFCQYNDPFDVRLCGTKAACEVPNIDHAMYYVSDKNDMEVEQFENGQTFPHRTLFLVYRRNESCSFIETNYTCNDGNWEGNLPHCDKGRQVQRKACRVQYDAKKYVVTYNGGVSENGASVPDNEAINVTCTLETPGIDVQSVYCGDGKWDFNIEVHILCKTQSFCQMVTNATMTGSFEDGFEIRCIDGHSIVADGLVPDRFSCKTHGVWEPFSPMCEPTNCTVPETDGKGSIADVNGALLDSGAVVLHGSDVILTCPVSYIPDTNSYTCSYGTYSTPGGKLPSCVQVTCGPPTVKGTKYKPRQKIYLYGDFVRIRRCKNRMKLVGDRKLECTKHGKWSSTAECKPSNCTVPETDGKGSIADVNGALLDSGAVVLHGSDVILTCPVSYIPDTNSYTCSYGTYSTPGGKIPSCVQVKCGPPPVIDASYIPRKDIYFYGDDVSIMKCKNKKELVGDKTLECTKHGNWSSTAECKPSNCTVPETDGKGSIADVNGALLDSGAVVLHGSDVILTCPVSYIPDTNSYACSYGTYSTPGGKLPSCVQVKCGPPPVIDASYIPRKDIYFYGDDVSIMRCTNKKQLVGDRKLECTKHGNWSSTPECQPSNCTVPETDGKRSIADVNGALLDSGAVVLHGSDVILSCPVSYIPDTNSYSCSYGTYSTPGGKLPSCVQVYCGPPTVKGTEYTPSKNIYLYGDYVRIKRCQNRMELVGDRKLECTKHGNWSSTAECKPYCHAGIDKFIRNQGKKLSNRAGWSSTSKSNSYESCQTKCRTRSYICRGFVFGHNGQHYTCTLYVSRPNVLMENLEGAPFWTTSIRVCETN